MKKQERFDVQDVRAKGAMLTQILTDHETGVQYLLAIYPNMGAGLTVMLDANGKPLLQK